MGSQRILGVIMLLVGIGLLVVGINASHSIADKATSTFTGHFTQATTWYILGGVAVGIVGLVALVGGGRGKSV